jgi:predicted nucleotidyltransferase
MNLPHNASRALAELQQALCRIYGDRLPGVYLYGSYARGDYHVGSDVDILYRTLLLSLFETSI